MANLTVKAHLFTIDTQLTFCTGVQKWSYAQCNVRLCTTVQTRGHHGVSGVGMVEAVVATGLIWKTSWAFDHSKFAIHSWKPFSVG